MTKQELYEIRNIIDDIKKNGLNEVNIMALYDIIGNEDIPLNITNFKFVPASFSPINMVISFNLKKSTEWVNQMIDKTSSMHTINNIELLKAYMTLFELAHEIEHSSQKLIADGLKDTDYEYKRDAYQNIYDFMDDKDFVIPRPITTGIDFVRYIIYKRNEYNMILERNASVEGFNLASLVAEAVGDNEINSYLISNRNAFLFQGYYDNCDGILKYTYKKLGLMKKYRKLDIPKDLSLYQRVRDGLEITEEERPFVTFALKQNMKLK